MNTSQIEKFIGDLYIVSDLCRRGMVCGGKCDVHIPVPECDNFEIVITFDGGDDDYYLISIVRDILL